MGGRAVWTAREKLLVQCELAAGTLDEAGMAGQLCGWETNTRKRGQAMARIALVTGGQRGIGAAISEHLQKVGRTVVASYAGNEEAARAFTERTGIRTYRFDVSDWEQCAEAVKRIEAEVGPIEVLVNNAGITRDNTMKRMDRKMWDDVIDTNLGSCFNLCKLVWEGMTARKFGRIVNIGSINGQAGQYGQVNYAAAKSGIHGFTKALAQEGARLGITVNAVAPGYVDTEMVRAVPADVLEKIIARIPRGRLGTADDIARGVAFLTADDADFITGSTLSINGGQHMY
jgi:acetoacetyl-CoA reductase